MKKLFSTLMSLFLCSNAFAFASPAPPPPPPPPNVVVTISTDKSSYAAGEPINITLRAENTSVTSEPDGYAMCCPDSYTIDNTRYPTGRVCCMAAGYNPLPGHASKEFRYTFTGGLAPGSHSLFGAISPRSSQYTKIEVRPPTCSDSDSGREYFVKGYVTISSQPNTTYTDSCTHDMGTGAYTLYETYCDGSQVSTETYTCPYACSDGACSDIPIYPTIFVHGHGNDTWAWKTMIDKVRAGHQVYRNGDGFYAGDNIEGTHGRDSIWNFGYYKEQSTDADQYPYRGKIGAVPVPRKIKLYYIPPIDRYTTKAGCTKLYAAGGPCDPDQRPVEVTDADYESRISYANQLRRGVNKILAATGASKVNIVAHSMGGLVSRSYIKWLGGKAKVNKLLMVATANHGISDLAEHVYQYGLEVCGQGQPADMLWMRTAEDIEQYAKTVDEYHMDHAQDDVPLYDGKSFIGQLDDGGIMVSPVKYATIAGDYHDITIPGGIFGQICIGWLRLNGVPAYPQDDVAVNVSEVQIAGAEFNTVIHAAHGRPAAGKDLQGINDPERLLTEATEVANIIRSWILTPSGSAGGVQAFSVEDLGPPISECPDGSLQDPIANPCNHKDCSDGSAFDDTGNPCDHYDCSDASPQDGVGDPCNYTDCADRGVQDGVGDPCNHSDCPDGSLQDNMGDPCVHNDCQDGSLHDETGNACAHDDCPDSSPPDDLGDPCVHDDCPDGSVKDDTGYPCNHNDCEDGSMRDSIGDPCDHDEDGDGVVDTGDYNDGTSGAPDVFPDDAAERQDGGGVEVGNDEEHGEPSWDQMQGEGDESAGGCQLIKKETTSAGGLMLLSALLILRTARRRSRPRPDRIRA